MLRELRPAASHIDRDQFFFRAGQAAAEVKTVTPRKHLAWRWPLNIVAAAVVSALATLGAVRFTAPGENTDGVPVHAVRSAPSEAITAPDRLEKPWREIATVQQPDASRMNDVNPGYEYLAMRRLVTTAGVDALPEPVSDPPSTTFPGARQYHDLLNDYISNL